MVFIAMSYFLMQPEGQVSLFLGFLRKTMDNKLRESQIYSFVKLMGENLFLFRCVNKLFENGHIVLNKYSKIPGCNIGIFIAY